MVNYTDELNKLSNIIENILSDENIGDGNEFFDTDYCYAVQNEPDVREEPYGQRNSLGISQDYRIALDMIAYDESEMPTNREAYNSLQSDIDYSYEVSQEYFFDDYKDELAKVGITDYKDVSHSALSDAGLDDLAEEFDDEFRRTLNDSDWYNIITCTIYENDNNNYSVDIDVTFKDAYSYHSTTIGESSLEFTPEELNNKSLERKISEKITDEIFTICEKF